MTKEKETAPAPSEPEEPPPPTQQTIEPPVPGPSVPPLPKRQQLNVDPDIRNEDANDT